MILRPLPGRTIGILQVLTIKTAVSVDDNLLREADRLAHQIGVSRSGLFSLALRDYLRARRQKEMLDKLNQVYGGEPDPAEARLPRQMKAKFRRTLRDPGAAWE